MGWKQAWEGGIFGSGMPAVAAVEREWRLAPFGVPRTAWPRRKQLDSNGEASLSRLFRTRLSVGRAGREGSLRPADYPPLGSAAIIISACVDPLKPTSPLAPLCQELSS